MGEWPKTVHWWAVTDTWHFSEPPYGQVERRRMEVAPIGECHCGLAKVIQEVVVEVASLDGAAMTKTIVQHLEASRSPNTSNAKPL